MRFSVSVGACLILGVALGALPSCDGDGGGPADGGAGTTGAAGASGGGGGTGGTGGTGGSAQSVLPSGTVTYCFGECPMGECDDDMFFADVACAAVYPSPVSPSTTYCNPGQTGVYCMMIENGTTRTRFGITCTNGVVFGKMCRGSCGTSGTNNLSCPS
jgi:hypothetical protein